ncbi:DUF5979 domain-containing protein [Microbacterium sp. H1-D42]|uniref:DUF5979 domain-containing protein n=1 Tax=Microbacterium sp. H1-D42 TaxID=2925844 RepID=UPI001F53D105|nr:DUF5979 domain-containing protein [Microbacterium sp. H1-D42]UNK70818.1 DUF5979 domain-containing protein [Microbacterium sp. H1-D42]
MHTFHAPAQARHSSAPSGAVRRIVAALSVGLLAIIGLVSVPAAAVAAANSDIVVGDVTLTPDDGQLTVGDTVTVSGSWDATMANPKEGDEFTIGLPDEFDFPEAVPFQLLGPAPDNEVWGNCMTDPGTGIATCTLTSLVTTKPELVQGTWEFEVKATKATTATEVEFDLNGTPGNVVLPGGGGIDDGIELPGEVSKSGVMNGNNWSMTWTVDIPGANLAAAGGDAHITDTFGAGHVLCAPTGFKVQTVRGDTVVDVTDLVETQPVAGAAGFDIVLSEPDAGWSKDVTYRITYQTCTPDGQIDPSGTKYDNSMQIEGWGEAGQGIGTVTNQPWHDDLTKSGSVLGGADRNGKIAWSVVIPGDQLFGKDSFTFSETLGAGHQVCEDTVSGLRVFERYGPSNQKDRDITDLLTRTATTTSTQAFSMKFTTGSGSFDFKKSDYRYIVAYDTCVTSTDLPEGGTGYTNSVDVDGKIATTEAKVPGRSEGKDGKINTTPVTIDGVQHMPQTTLNWNVTIPGALLDPESPAEGAFDPTGALTLFDVLSDTQAICEAGDPTGGLASRLNLRVQAVDQINKGGLATVDLTDTTDVSVDGQKITFKVAPPKLPQPTGGVSDGFSREYQYTLSYTTCTTSGGMDAPGTVYGNELTGKGISFTDSMTQSNKGSGTGTGVTRGSVAISKLLADTPGAEFVPAGTKFTVHVKEIDPKGVAQNEYDLQVPVNGDPISGLNARGNGWTIELSEPTFPSVPGVAWGKPIFKASDGVTPSADGTTAVAALTPGSNIKVSVENRALLGSVAVTKALTGPEAATALVDPDQTYKVMVKIDTSKLGEGVPTQADREFGVKAGETVTLKDLPIGAIVTFSETKPTSDDDVTWSAPVISPNPITIGAEHATEPAAVTVTNHVERTLGTFSIAKSVTGAQAENPAVPENVTVTASWTQEGVDGEKVLTVPTDGSPVDLGADLLIGTKVTLVETPLVDGSSIAWSAPVWSGTGVTVDGSSAVVTIVRDVEAHVDLENHAATSVADISLIKGIAGAAAGEVDADTEFPVTATWTDAEDETVTKDLMINAVKPTPLGVELPAGTVVTITEGKRPGIDTVVWGSITISGDDVTDNGDGSAEIIVSDQQGDTTLVTVVNEATWAPSSFSISKSLADTPGAEFVADGTEFTVHVKEFSPSGDLEKEYDLQVPVNGAVVKGQLNLSGPGWTAELSEPTFPNVPGVTWGSPVFAASDGVTPSADGKTATVAFAPSTDVKVGLVNEAELGMIDVTKALTGPEAALALVDEDKSYVVTAKIDTSKLGEGFPAQADRVLQIKAGETVTIKDLPIGATVNFSEAQPTDDDRLTWSAPVISPASIEVAAAHATAPVVVTVTNHVERTVGTFSIAKSVTGAQAENPAVPENVTVTATWTQDGVDGEKTLAVPTDGTPVALGENLLIGTKVTLVETPLVDGSSIAWSAPVWSGDGVAVDGTSAVVSITRDGEAQVLLENHAATSVAGISLIKGIAGDATEEVDPATEFPVTATWTIGDEEFSKELTINAVEPTSLGVDLPAGTVVTITEGERPAFDTVIWDSITISGDDVTDNGDGSAEIIVSDQQGDTTLVTVVNEATWAPGTFTLSKAVTGILMDNPDVPETVTVTASWLDGDEPMSAEVTLPTDGTPVPFGQDLPHGTTVTLSELTIEDGAAFTWNTPVWSGDAIVAHEDGTAVLTIGAAKDAKVAVTNSVTAKLGSLAVNKSLTGSGAGLVKDVAFPVTATWTDLLGETQQTDIEVRAGEATVIENLPMGTEVTLTETAAEVPANARWHGATWTSDDETVALDQQDGDAITIIVTGDGESTASVDLGNEFEKLPDLAVTGGPLLSGAIIVLAGLLIGVGILMLVLRRRREA